MGCNKNWWKCQAGWTGMCKIAYECYKESVIKEFGEEAFEILNEFIRSGTKTRRN